MKHRFAVLVLGLVLVAPFVPVAAQENSSSQKPAAEKPDMVPLKLDFVISRQMGDKKISSLPYSMWVTANTSGARVRMGVQVPIVQTVFGSDKEKGEAASAPQRSYTYRNIGTNIDASAATAAGRYRVSVTLEESGLHEKGDTTTGAPLIRSFNSSFQLLLSDRQTATFTSATDPATGETLKVDLTLTVLK